MVATSLIPAGVLAPVKAKCAEVVAATGVVTHVWGYNTVPDHNNKRCIDFMVRSIADGDRVAQYLRANAGRLGLAGMIWNRKVMGFPENGRAYAGPSGTWRTYLGPSPHTDHIHAEFNSAAYIAPAGGSAPANTPNLLERITSMYNTKAEFEAAVRDAAEVGANRALWQSPDDALPAAKKVGGSWAASLKDSIARTAHRLNEVLKRQGRIEARLSAIEKKVK